MTMKAMCSSCGESPVYIPQDIHGLCEKCGNEYVEGLLEDAMESEPQCCDYPDIEERGGADWQSISQGC